METIKEMEKRHQLEFRELQTTCLHTEVEILDGESGFRRRSICLRCSLCGKPIVGWERDGDNAFVAYAQGFVKKEGIDEQRV